MMGSRRWTVTYTKHVKQKRKVYQDGVLELCCTSNKVLLYDEHEKLIDSRFLKKDEVIEGGGMLPFETHLVDVGCPEGNCSPLKNLNVSGRDVRAKEVTGTKEQKGNKKITSHGGLPQNHLNLKRDSTREWIALYTTQITQKAKRYHDGILRLSVCGSQMNQVTLLHEDGTILTSKYLRSVECVKTGSTLEVPNYLIEICEPRIFKAVEIKDPPQEVTSSSTSAVGKFTSREILTNKPLRNDLQKSPSEKVLGCLSPSVSNFPSSEKLVNNRPLRNVCQILSILNESVPEENYVPKKLPMEQICSSESSDIPLDGQKSSKRLKFHAPGMQYSREILEEYSGKVHEDLDVGLPSQVDTSGNPCRQHGVSYEGPFSSITSLTVNDNQPLDHHTSSSLNFGASVSEASATEKIMKYADNVYNDKTWTIGSIVSDIDTGEPPRVNQTNASRNIVSGSGNGPSNEQFDNINKIVPVNKSFAFPSNGNQHLANLSCNDLKENIGTCSSISGNDSIGIWSSDNVKNENYNQIDAENTKAERGCERIHSVGASSPASAGSDSKEKVSKFQTLTRFQNVDEIPTFDLGF